jgi:hypothetical protein
VNAYQTPARHLPVKTRLSNRSQGFLYLYRVAHSTFCDGIFCELYPGDVLDLLIGRYLVYDYWVSNLYRVIVLLGLVEVLLEDCWRESVPRVPRRQGPP